MTSMKHPRQSPQPKRRANLNTGSILVPDWFGSDMRPEWLFPLWARKLSNAELLTAFEEIWQQRPTNATVFPPGLRRRAEVLFIEKQYREAKGALIDNAAPAA